MWHEVAERDSIAPGGMKCVRVRAHELCLCEYDGAVFAVSRRCGDMNAPLEQGALQGWVLTCPLHHAQFDIRSGENLCRPIEQYLGGGPLPEPVERFLKLERRLRGEIRIHDLRTYPVRVHAGLIEVDLPEADHADDA